MTSRTWVGGTGSWGSAAGWSPEGVPGAADAAVLGAAANVTIPSGAAEAVGSVSLADPTASLTVDGSLQNATVQLQGGQLAGTGALDNDTIVGTLTTDALSVEQTVTLDVPPGQPGLIVRAPGGTVAGVGQSSLDGGVVLAGSPDPSHPIIFEGNGGLFTLSSALDVTGAVVLGDPRGSSAFTDFGPVNVAPGGDLVMQYAGLAFGPIHIASGTVDDSSGAFSPYVTFDDSAGKLVLSGASFAETTGFRAGDTIDVKGVSISGALTPTPEGLMVGYPIGLSATAPGATYTAAPDGSGGTLITTTAQPVGTVAFVDQTTGTTGSHPLDTFVPNPLGPTHPAYLQLWYEDEGADTVAMTASTPDVFLKGGGGEKALAVSSGQNVLDGGTGSAFLAGGTGSDTFFVSLIGSAQVWDTLANFHAGDAVTVWGWVPGVSTETVDAQAGAAGYQGATLHLSNGMPGSPVSSVTFAGLSADQLAHLQTSTGTAGGVSYLYLHNPGV